MGNNIIIASALNVDLWSLPQFPASSIVWKDRPMQINGINAQATHLRANTAPEEVITFYQKFGNT